MTQTSPDENHRGPVPVNRFEWERLLMMSGDLPQEDRFKLLPLGIFMDGDTGEGARPGAANLALMGHHEETWKQLLRRAVASGWLILRERGGSRKGPNGTRIKRASRYAASVPAEVYDRRREILDAPPFRAPSKEAPGAEGGLPSKDSALPSYNGTSTKEVPSASFEPPAPVDNPPHAAFEGSLPGYEGSPETLPSTSTKEARESTKEVPEGYEGSLNGLRRKSPETSPSISPSSNLPTSKIRSDRSARDDVQDRKGARWLAETWPGVTEPIAAHIIQAVRDEAARYGNDIDHLVPYLKRMGERGDLVDYVSAAFDLDDQAAAHDLQPPDEPEEPEPPPLRALEGSARGPGKGSTQPPILNVVPHAQPEPAAEPAPVLTEAERAALIEETAQRLAKIQRGAPVDRAEVDRAMTYLKTLPVRTYLALCKQAKTGLGAGANPDAVTLRAAALAREQHDERKHG